MRLEDIKVNTIDDMPCECGRDLGPWSGSGATPMLVEGTEGLAEPHTDQIAIAVEAPATEFVWCMNTHGKIVSRVRIHAGGLHVMYSPLGGSMQFSVPADLLDPSDPDTVGAFGTSEHGNIDIDPRAILLERFWAQKGYDNVRAFAIARTGPVPVTGAISCVSIGTRWFDSDLTVHAGLGARTIVCQGQQTRFLTHEEMQHEFMSLLKPDGSRVMYRA